MSETSKEIRYALRMLGKKPWTTCVAALQLMLGIGANVAIFSIINSLLLEPLPFPEANRLAQVVHVTPEEQSSTFGISRFDFWRQHGSGFSAMTAYDAHGYGFKLRGPDGTEVIHGARVTADFFTTFGSTPLLGTPFRAEDDRFGAPLVAVLSHHLWVERFGGDPQILGRPLTIDGETATVIGVMPPGFRFPSAAELWTPLRLDPTNNASILRVTVRLADTQSVAAAAAELDGVDRRNRPPSDDAERISAVSLQSFLYGDLRPALLVTLAAVALVLVIACANVANLQLARAATRQREIAIRLAMGARPGGIVRLLLIESVLLSLSGGILGLGICYLSLGPMLALAPAELRSQFAAVNVDGSALGFAVALSLVTGILTGLVPAIRAGRMPIRDVIQEESSGSGIAGGRRGGRMRHGLVILEIALALTLMISAGLLVKSFAGLRRTELGFRPDHLLTLKIHLPEDRYGPPSAVDALRREVLPAIAGLAGVRGATLTTSLPLEQGAEMPFVIRGATERSVDVGSGMAQYRGVSPGYFETMDIALVEGRGFEERDRADAPLVAMVNETAAHQLFQDQALGQRIVIGLPDMPPYADPAPREIVGIVRDVRELGLESSPPAILYVPAAQIPEKLNPLLLQLLPMNLVVRTELAPASVTRAVTEKIWAYDPELPVTGVGSMETVLARSIGAEGFQMLLIGLLGALALVLSVLGTYAVLTYLVGQRLREIALRMTLGGDAWAITTLVLGQGMTLVVAGCALGLLGAWAATRLLASLLYGVSPTDWVTFLSVTLFMIAAAFFATFIPARRACRVDPMEALRCP